ncbi:MAG: hypothetical protein ACT4QC_23160 [Planctomycetaceae bacterium]
MNSMKHGLGIGRRRRLALFVVLGGTWLAGLSGCGGAAGEFRDLVETRESARKTLEAQGAKFTRRRLPVVGPTTIVNLSGSKDVSDATFVALRELGNVITELNLSDTNVNDRHLAMLNDRELSGGLAKLNLSDTEITDKGLEEITNMFFLGELDLSHTKVTAEGIRAFLKTRAENENVKIRKPKIKR